MKTEDVSPDVENVSRTDSWAEGKLNASQSDTNWLLILDCFQCSIFNTFTDNWFTEIYLFWS